MRGHARGIWFATIAAALALGCGSGDSEPAAGEAAPAAPAAPQPGAPESTAAATLQAMYEWDPAAGEGRDLAEDVAECSSQVTGKGLAGVAEHIECMQRKGWKTRPPES
jgi:hypothetical protein